MDYLLHLIVISCVYVTLAVSLDMLAGHTGILSVCHAAFFALGAYTSTLLAVRLGFAFPLALLAGMLSAAMFSVAVSLPSVRLRDDFFVIATFAFQLIFSSLLNNWTVLTRGPLGIPGIPTPRILGWTVASRGDWVFLAALMATVAFTAARLLTGGPFGRVLRAIREDESFARALGKETNRFKATVFAVSGAIAAAAGSLYGHYVGYIDPTSFSLGESILIVSMVIIGGAGSLWGPALGAVGLVALPELLRLIGFPAVLAANLRQVLYGLLLVIAMVLRPQGLFGKYGFER